MWKIFGSIVPLFLLCVYAFVKHDEKCSGEFADPSGFTDHTSVKSKKTFFYIHLL